MFKKTKVCTSLMLAFGGSVAFPILPAFAQQQLERVEITGSSIRRVDAESALPVLVLKRGDIERSGVTSTVDLLRKLPTVQGSTGESASVGGTTFGFSGVSVHNVGETRTLVLLNGHRLALFGGQSLTGFAAGMDLNAIPVSAIERVEVLTDGASALYGADAIAGVVNFITKKDTKEGDITVGVSDPKDGAREKRVSLSKGFGSLNDDGFNAFVTFAHDERTKLDSTERNFASSGRVFFNANGKSYRFQQFSNSPIPANVVNDAGNLVSPWLITHGSCPAKTFQVVDGSDNYCGFDFVGELEIYPVRSRDSFVGEVYKKVGNQTLFLEALVSRTKQTSRIAPVPGNIAIPANSPLAVQYLQPIGIFNDTVAPYRLYDLGKRTHDDQADFTDIAFGSRGQLFNWDYEATYTHSQSKAKGNISGYPGALALSRLTASGLLDPFVLAGQQSPAALAAIQATNYNGYWDGGKSILDTVSLHGSHELMNLPGGPLSVGAGINVTREKFQSEPSLFAQGKLADPVAGTLCDPNNPALPCDQRFGDSSATVPYSAKRTSYGIFGEVIFPVLKGLELGTAVRYDHYSDFGSATTAKASFRWQPAKDVLFRGSIGSGFHAPTVPQVNAATQPFGVTSDNYTCTAALAAVAAAQGAECRPGNAQYDVLAGGNQQLRPEKSVQGTLGVRFDTAVASFGVDLWHVNIRDAFGQLTEQTVFANPGAFPSSWGKNLDVGTGKTYLAFLANNQNLGKWFSTGLDFDVSGRLKTGFGDVTSGLTLTYMIREDQQLERNGLYFSAIGDNGALGTVTFRWQGRWTTTLKQGNWAHTLGVNFKSGYRDQVTTVDVMDAAGNVVATEDIRLPVARYVTADWQTQWNPIKSLTLSIGVLNIFNVDPPFSLSTAGINKGQQFGYDDRYYDPRGRTWYGNLSYKF